MSDYYAIKNNLLVTVNQLMTLVEEEELGEISIYDFVPNSNDPFQRLLEDKESLEVCKLLLLLLLLLRVSIPLISRYKDLWKILMFN